MTPALPALTPADRRPPPGRPLAVTTSPALLDDLLRLAAAADVTMTVASEMEAARRHWSSAPAVVVGMDLVDTCIAAGLPERRHVILVGEDADDGRVWDTSVRIGADHVIFLPEAEPWLVDLLTDLDDLDRRQATVIGLVNGQTGSGASALAVSLSLIGLRRDLRTMLVDADPLGGGLVPAFAEQVPALVSAFRVGGFRVPPGSGSPPDNGPDTRSDDGPEGGPEDRRGGMDGDAATSWLDLLPRRGDLAVVSWDSSVSPAVPTATMATLMSTARCTSDLVVVDLPSGMSAAADVALRTCHLVLVLASADRRSVAAADRVAAAASRQCPDVRAVVRAQPADDLSPEKTAAIIGLPLAGVIAIPSDPPERRQARPDTPPPGMTPRQFGEQLFDSLGLDRMELDRIELDRMELHRRRDGHGPRT